MEEKRDIRFVLICAVFASVAILMASTEIERTCLKVAFTLLCFIAMLRSADRFVDHHAWESAYDDALADRAPVVALHENVGNISRIPIIARIVPIWKRHWIRKYRHIYYGRPPFLAELQLKGYIALPNEYRNALRKLAVK